MKIEILPAGSKFGCMALVRLSEGSFENAFGNADDEKSKFIKKKFCQLALTEAEILMLKEKLEEALMELKELPLKPKNIYF